MFTTASSNIYIILINSFVLLFILILILYSWSQLILPLKKVPVSVWFLLVIVLFTTLFIRLLIYPHYHFMYCDDWYPLDVAKNIVLGKILDIGSQNFISNGLLFVPTFLFFGIKDSNAFVTTVVAGVLSLLLLFMLAYIVTKKHWPALFAVTLMAFNISHITYSLSTYNHIFVFFFAILSLYAFFLYFRSESMPVLYLSLLSFAFLIYLRIEMFLLILIMFPLYIIYAVRKKSRRKNSIIKAFVPWMLLGIVVLLAFPQYLNFIDIQKSRPIEFGISDFWENTKHGMTLFELNYLFIILILIGIMYLVKDKKWWALCMLASSVIFAVLYLQINPSHISGGRHLIYSVSILYIVLGYVVFSLAKLIKYRKIRLISLLLIFFCLFVFGIYKSTNHALTLRSAEDVNELYFSTKIPEYMEKIVEPDCLILSPHPVRFSATTGFDTAAINVFKKGMYNESCILFVADISCQYPMWEVKGECEKFLQEYNLTKYSYIDSNMIKPLNRRQVINYTIYRVD